MNNLSESNPDIFLPMISYRKESRKGVKFTFMVVGDLGTGKTTFINTLLNKPVLSHKFEKSLDTTDIRDDMKGYTFTSNSIVLPNVSGIDKDEFNPKLANEEPGIALTETKVEIYDNDNLKLLLSIIDSPGFGENLNNEMCFYEIENYLKQQFDLVLAEETKIKRNPRFTDTRVHALLYFIAPTGHGLKSIDICCMKRLSKYVNILPIISKADSFTHDELKMFKKQINADIKNYSIPVFQFNYYLDNNENDCDLNDEPNFLLNLQPFAIILSENEYEVIDAQTGKKKIIKAREYPWGLIDINNPHYSDFSILKSVVLGSHLQELKDLTLDYLYETYRTERLTSVTRKKKKEDLNINFRTQNNKNKSTASDISSSNNQINKIILSTSENADDFSEKNNDQHLDKKNESYDLKIKTSSSFVMNSDASTNSKSDCNFDTSNSQNRSDFDDVNSIKSVSDFKRLSIGPQRDQLRKFSETIPYVIRHERIVERQQKLEQIKLATAKELENKAAILDKKASELRIKEKSLKIKLMGEKKKDITP